MVALPAVNLWLLVALSGLAAGLAALWLRGRERAHQRLEAQLSTAVESRSVELNQRLAELARSEARKSAILESALDAIISVDECGDIVEFNPAAERIFGYSREQAIGTAFTGLVALESQPVLRLRRQRRGEGSRPVPRPQPADDPVERRHEIVALRSGGAEFPAEVAISRVRCEGEGLFIAYLRDLTERKRAEQELHEARESARVADLARIQAQKLESIGQLAAGIAHEINTPIQYVGDNIRFLKDAFRDLARCGRAAEQFAAEIAAGYPESDALALFEAARREVDVDYLNAETPLAIEQSIEGVSRVAAIVRAMKEFSHPGPASKSATDINHAIRNTILVSKNEWKYVAEVVEDLDPDLPLVPCLAGELNQAILNLIVNAAHAIADVVRERPQSEASNDGPSGTITLRTRRDEDWVQIEVQDTGTGIPEWCRPHIFNLFFTTKEPGKGTGQGLAFVYSSIVQKHGGQVHFETEPGVGTTFMIRLPLNVALEEAA